MYQTGETSMRIVKLGGLALVLCLFALPTASFAYQSSGDFPGASDGPALASDHSQQLDFGFSPSAGLGLASESRGASLDESSTRQRPVTQSPNAPAQNSPSEFDQDFYGIR